MPPTFELLSAPLRATLARGHYLTLVVTTRDWVRCWVLLTCPSVIRCTII